MCSFEDVTQSHVVFTDDSFPPPSLSNVPTFVLLLLQFIFATGLCLRHVKLDFVPSTARGEEGAFHKSLKGEHVFGEKKSGKFENSFQKQCWFIYQLIILEGTR